MNRLFNIISCIGGKHSLLYYLKTSEYLPKISDNSLAYCGKIIVLWEKEFQVLNELSFSDTYSCSFDFSSLYLCSSVILHVSSHLPELAPIEI